METPPPCRLALVLWDPALAPDVARIREIAVPKGKNAVTIGRAAVCDVAFPKSATLSRTHAKLEVTPDGGLAVTDAFSVNKVYVNKNMVVQGIPYPLKKGDKVSFGTHSPELEFRVVQRITVPEITLPSSTSSGSCTSLDSLDSVADPSQAMEETKPTTSPEVVKGSESKARVSSGAAPVPAAAAAPPPNSESTKRASEEDGNSLSELKRLKAQLEHSLESLTKQASSLKQELADANEARARSEQEANAERARAEELNKAVGHVRTTLSKLADEIEDILECPICSEVKPLYVLECGHGTCLDCWRQIQGIASSKKKKPVCSFCTKPSERNVLARFVQPMYGVVKQLRIEVSKELLPAKVVIAPPPPSPITSAVAASAGPVVDISSEPSASPIVVVPADGAGSGATAAAAARRRARTRPMTPDLVELIDLT